MKDLLRRTWAPILAVTVAQLAINSMPVSISGGFAEAIPKAVLFLGVFLATSFLGGAVHAGLLRRRSDAAVSVCLLDGATIGLLSNLIAQALSLAMHGSSLDLLMPPSGAADPVLWIWKLVLSFVIVMIFGFTGLLSGGMGGGLGSLVSLWAARTPPIRRKHD